ncbi:Lysoplasmalogenase-like protein tmem86a, partial [Xenoophorus captivus]
LLMFAISHILYSSAFGMKPTNVRAGLVITAASALCYLLLYPYLSGPFTYLVAVYTALIGFMGWRAIAGLQLANDLWTWTKLSACLGAVLFMVSDLTIAVNKFCFPVPHSRAIIMATYYAAQMLIALSAVECQDVELTRAVNDRVMKTEKERALLLAGLNLLMNSAGRDILKKNPLQLIFNKSSRSFFPSFLLCRFF